MKALVACEESQVVCIELRKRGWDAYSCDIQECSGGHPEWHIQGDVLNVLNPTQHCTPVGDVFEGIEFKTVDGVAHTIQPKWDLIIAHPPCTYLTVTGNRWFNVERYGEKAIQRAKDREEAVEFFANVPKIKAKLDIMMDVGLSYVELGQGAPTLSGGEAGRVKLAKELQKKPTGKSLFILDEPTTGLHSADIKKLLVILKKLKQEVHIPW